jgi:hypothetical protein
MRGVWAEIVMRRLHQPLISCENQPVKVRLVPARKERVNDDFVTDGRGW